MKKVHNKRTKKTTEWKKPIVTLRKDGKQKKKKWEETRYGKGGKWRKWKREDEKKKKQQGKEKKDEKQRGKVELKGRNERNGWWVRVERDGGKQMTGKMKSEEKSKKHKNKEGQKQ